MALLVAYLISEWIHVVLQILMIIFHAYRLSFVAPSKSRRSATLCKVITLTTVSYAIMAANTGRFLFMTSITTVNAFTPYLNDTNCYYIKRMQFSIIILSRLFVHLFVAMRSRLSTTHTKSKWYKLGLWFLILDILLFLFAVSPVPQFTVQEIDGVCITVTLPKVIMLWLLFNDIFIGLYSLFAFVLPLRRLINTNDKENVEDLAFMVKKIITFSSIALFITVLMIMVTIAFISAASMYYVYFHFLSCRKQT